MGTVLYKQSIETLTRILQTVKDHLPGAYLRFGDGDANLADG